MEEFIIPVIRTDLLKRSGSNQYYVSKLVNIASLSNHVQVCEQEFRERGHLFINGMFDYLFSAIHYWNEIDAKMKERTWEILLKTCKKSAPDIVEALKTALSREDQNKYRCSIKMNIYLLCQIIELFTNEMHQASQLVEKGKGKKKKTPTQIDMLDEIEMALNAMSQLFHCKINKFWDPPIVEEDFINLVCNTCYKLLESQDICKKVSIRDGITKLIINMVKHYNHNLICSVKLVQLLHGFPHFASHLVHICRGFTNAENMGGIIRDILSEICSYSSVDLERNNQAASSFSTFLVELAIESPNSLIPMLHQLTLKLDEDPPTLRNCVLVILGEIVIQVYSRDDSYSANRDSLIELIEDHVIEINGNVRSKALAVLLSIVEKCKLPLGRLARLMGLLVGEQGAIFDTSSFARRNSIRIISRIVELDVSKGLSYIGLKERQDEEKETIAKLEEQIEAMRVTGELADAEMQLEHIRDVMSESGLNQSRTGDRVEPIQSQSVAREALEKQLINSRGVILILGQMMEITKLTEAALSDILCMLSSKVSSDVLEAIGFLVKARGSQLAGVDHAVRKMLPHICSKDDAIRAAVTTAYSTLYLAHDDEEDHDGHGDRCNRIVDSLTQLVANPTSGELTCIEKLLINFVGNGDIDNDVIECLWSRFRGHDNRRDCDETAAKLSRKYALILFSMIANVDQPCMGRYFNLLINEGIPSSGYDTVDLQYVEYMCITIQNMTKAKKVEKLAEPFRLPSNHILFERLIKLCTSTFTQSHKQSWVPMTNEAIGAIYLLAENPNLICLRIETMLSKDIVLTYESEYGGDGGEDSADLMKCKSFMLARYIEVAGHIAMKQFIHFDGAILSELKRRNNIKEEKDQVKKTKKLVSSQKRKTGVNGDKANETNLEEEMGLVGATADDAEAEFIRKLCENELVCDPTRLLSKLLSLVVFICSNVSRFMNKDLQKLASLSLGKMMLISSRVCMDHIELLFSLAARSPSEIIRANLIVPLGDLIKRFTTLLEPYTPHLYGRLRDTSPLVRLNALNVLSHLILNDMIKVKGQISEMTTCIIDENPRITHLAKIFFQELANKDKALYNVMPDIISRLSSPQTGVEEVQFRTIMEYLMPFIQKKNQTENLFEKICARFHSANDERSWRDLSYCLSLLTFNESMLRALQFNLPSFVGKLHVDAVFEAINGIITTFKKTAKSEIVAVVEEMSTALQKLRDQGVEDEEANVSAVRAAASKKKNRRRSGNKPKKSSTRDTAVKMQMSRLANDDDDDGTASVASSRPRRACQKTPQDKQLVDDDNRIDVFSDDDSDTNSSSHSDSENASLADSSDDAPGDARVVATPSRVISPSKGAFRKPQPVTRKRNRLDDNGSDDST